ncbi:acylneuraminate cytidylyltransferase family protein [Aureibaculum conchae]|uniref:acylneuraminate cytidylyltransferase family protein n=1 Tax=Aureibaculum sp. 2308TA14-22 TaxID=3108392 RepID=UPI003390ACCF
MKILGIIPARGGSKGVKKKNIKHLGNKPLLVYTIEVAEASALTDVIVSTDDEEIAKVAKEYGGKVPFLRPEELATDNAKAIPVIQHALVEAEKLYGKEYDAVMMLQPTTPFKIVEDINNAIAIMQNSNCDSVISVVDVEGHHPARMKFIEDDRLIDPPYCEAYENQPRQELEPMYIRNGAVYLTRKEILMNDSFKGEDSRALIMPNIRSVNIDTELEFKYAEWILKEKLINA